MECYNENGIGSNIDEYLLKIIMNRRILFGNSLNITNLLASLPSIKYLSRLNPEISTYLPINRDFLDLGPIFSNLYYLDGTFAARNAKLTDIDNKNTKLFKFVNVHDPSQLLDPQYFKTRHLTQEIFHSYFNKDCPDLDIQIELNKWFGVPHLDKYVAMFYDSNEIIDRKVVENVRDLFKGLGYHIMWVDNDWESLSFENIQDILSCEFAITINNDLNYILSGYKFPLIGLYSNKEYIVNEVNYIKNVQPVNPNAIYLDSGDINDIEIDRIENAIKLIEL